MNINILKNVYVGLIILLGIVFYIFSQHSEVKALMPVVNNSLESNYIVTFDGEGEATVVSSLAISNYTDSSIKEIQMEIPGKTISIVRALHHFTRQEQERYCNNYYYSEDNTKRCSQEQERTVTKDHFDILAPKIETGANAIAVTIPLKTEIESTKNGTIYLVYKATGYAIGKWGGLSTFAYKTPVFKQSVDSVNVAVYTDQELYLLNAGKGKTNYVPNITKGIENFVGGSAMPLSFTSDFSKATDSEQTFTKKGSNLDAGESLTVTGRYATTWFRLYFIHLLGAVSGIGIFIIIIWLGEKSLARK